MAPCRRIPRSSTRLALALYFFLATRVAAARGRYGVPLPATTSHPDFERVSRVHQNTLEWMPNFFVLWLCAIYLNDIAATSLGLGSAAAAGTLLVIVRQWKNV